MVAFVQAPLEIIEAVAALRLPHGAVIRLHALMACNASGALTSMEREELQALVELSETLSLVRAQALHLLGRDPA